MYLTYFNQLYVNLFFCLHEQHRHVLAIYPSSHCHLQINFSSIISQRRCTTESSRWRDQFSQIPLLAEFLFLRLQNWL